MAHKLGWITILVVAICCRTWGDATTSTREFTAGGRRTFSTKGHQKSNGLDLRISYPQSWSPAEGDRSTVVQKFTSEGGGGLETVMINIEAIPIDPATVTAADEEEMLSVAMVNLRKSLPPGTTIIGGQQTKIERLPAELLEYRSAMERVGKSVVLHTWSISFVFRNTFVHVTCSVGGLRGSEAQIDQRMADFKPLFWMIVNSIVLPEKFARPPTGQLGNKPQTGNPPLLTELLNDNPVGFASMVIVSVCVTWGLGLAVPLIVRYMIVRHPISSKHASIIAGISSAFFFLAFRLLNASQGNAGGHGAVWLLVFFVGRWIMTRNRRQTPPPTPPIQRDVGVIDFNQFADMQAGARASQGSVAPPTTLPTGETSDGVASDLDLLAAAVRAQKEATQPRRNQPHR